MWWGRAGSRESIPHGVIPPRPREKKSAVRHVYHTRLITASGAGIQWRRRPVPAFRPPALPPRSCCLPALHLHGARTWSTQRRRRRRACTGGRTSAELASTPGGHRPPVLHLLTACRPAMPLCAGSSSTAFSQRSTAMRMTTELTAGRRRPARPRPQSPLRVPCRSNHPPSHPRVISSVRPTSANL